MNFNIIVLQKADYIIHTSKNCSIFKSFINTRHSTPTIRRTTSEVFDPKFLQLYENNCSLYFSHEMQNIFYSHKFISVSWWERSPTTIMLANTTNTRHTLYKVTFLLTLCSWKLSQVLNNLHMYGKPLLLALGAHTAIWLSLDHLLVYRST